LVDGTAYVRLLRYLPGGTLQDSGYLSPTAVAGLGEVAGRVSRALDGFSHPGLDRILQWDLRYGADVVAELISHVADPVHLDMTDANVVVSRSAGASARPDGVIDFGDLSDSWAVSELAITASSVLGRPGTDPTSILPAVRKFHALRPLTAVEVAAVWPLLVHRRLEPARGRGVDGGRSVRPVGGQHDAVCRAAGRHRRRGEREHSRIGGLAGLIYVASLSSIKA
jgi:Ser/Thr protein kinase RdoA (MazF antagonist)